MVGQESDEPRGAAQVLRGGDVSRLIGHLIAMGGYACIAVALFAVVQLFRFGLRYDHAWLLVAAIASGAVLFGYPFLAFPKFHKRRGVLLMMLSFGAFIPYLFGCYLVFFRGFWGLRDGLTLFTAFRTTAFVLLGHAVVSAIHKVTGFVKAVDEGRLRLE